MGGKLYKFFKEVVEILFFREKDIDAIEIGLIAWLIVLWVVIISVYSFFSIKLFL